MTSLLPLPTEHYFNHHVERFIGEWSEFLRFRSISADPAYADECVQCAEWLGRHLTAMGFEVQILPTSSKPVVFAEYRGPPDRPTVLFYGHYDVQPVEPLEEWKSPPFDPEIRDGRMFARGAEDNKGQTFFVLKAIECLIAEKKLNCSLKLFIEGEEECGSFGAEEILALSPKLFAADVLMVCDTEAMSLDVPAITMGLRGSVAINARIGELRSDLHSGVYGGVVRNPATEMCRLIASLHRGDGSVAVAGFYDKVREWSAAERALVNAAPCDVERFAEEIGLPPVGGEQGFTLHERRGIRPTVEINGVHSGYGGPGSKTIIPAYAEARITARVVPDQVPWEVSAQICEHLKQYCAAGVHLQVSPIRENGRYLSVLPDHPVMRRTRAILDSLSGGKTVHSWSGGSIPVLANMVEALNLTPVLVGYALDEGNAHAPNENFSLAQFRKGFEYASHFLAEPW